MLSSNWSAKDLKKYLCFEDSKNEVFFDTVIPRSLLQFFVGEETKEKERAEI